jgi:hypothetical protein
MARVSAAVSAASMPRQTMAMASAAAWASLQLPSTRPCTKARDVVGGQRAAVALGADDFGGSHGVRASGGSARTVAAQPERLGAA